MARDHRAVYEEDALVLHRVFPPDRREWFSRSWQMAAFPALVRDVPELRGRSSAAAASSRTGPATASTSPSPRLW